MAFFGEAALAAGAFFAGIAFFDCFPGEDFASGADVFAGCGLTKGSTAAESCLFFEGGDTAVALTTGPC